eukprot:scaffold25665_cov135-Isochrysis_galbana.AAC.6
MYRSNFRHWKYMCGKANELLQITLAHADRAEKAAEAALGKCRRHPSPRHIPERVGGERGLGKVRVEEAKTGQGETDGDVARVLLQYP